MAYKNAYQIFVPQQCVPITFDQVIDPPIRGFRTAEAGDVSIVDANGTTYVIPALLAGETFKCVIQKITSANTTVSAASKLTGLR